MPIDFDAETSEITSRPKPAEGCLDCEKVMLQNIRKRLQNGNNFEKFILYLE